MLNDAKYVDETTPRAARNSPFEQVGAGIGCRSSGVSFKAAKALKDALN